MDAQLQGAAMNVDQPQQNHTDKHPDVGPPTVRLRIQTPRGLWSMDQPPNAQKRPKYAISTKVEQVIADARSVFGFVEEDSKYTLLRGGEVLEPQRTLASYHIEDDTLLVLSVQGGNA
jgi:hypothetical protein